MNRIFFSALALAVFVLPVPAQTIQVNKDNRTIAITTTDEAQAIADRAQVSIGFTLYGTDQDATYADASKTSNAIMAALKAAGIKPEAIESTEQSLSAIDDNDKVRYSKGIRFVASQGWSVTVAADSAAETLHVAIIAGANNSGNINWQLADDSKLESDAAEKALVHARHIAEQMTKGLNVTLGPLVYASNQTPPRPGIFGYAVQAESASVSSYRNKNRKPLAIRPDKITKSATVYAVFSLQ
jgi:uncharacterized protein YggE